VQVRSVPGDEYEQKAARLNEELGSRERFGGRAPLPRRSGQVGRYALPGLKERGAPTKRKERQDGLAALLT